MSDTDATSFRRAAWTQIQLASQELTRAHTKGAIEAIIFAAPDAVTLRELTRATKAKRKAVLEIIDELAEDYADRGIQLRDTARGYRFMTHPDYAKPVRAITGKKPIRMSRAQLEALAIIAYRQPVTRPEIDDIRGVDSGPVLRTLLDRDLVRVLGKKEEPGRPLLYGTTDGFLDLLGLKTLGELPTLREFTELSDTSKDTYERKLGEAAPADAIEFDDEPDAPIDPTVPLEDELDEDGDLDEDSGSDNVGEDELEGEDGDDDLDDDEGEDDDDLDDEEEDDEDEDDDDLDDEEEDDEDDEDDEDLDDEEDDDEDDEDLDDEEEDDEDDEDLDDEEEDDEDDDVEDDFDDEDDEDEDDEDADDEDEDED